MAAYTIIAILTAITLLFYVIKRKYSYWERKGIPFIPPSIPFGNFKDFSKMHQGDFTRMHYNRMKGNGKFFGFYGFQNPIAVATDLDFIKNVMIKDFVHFQDRRMYTNEKDDPLSAHLFSIGGGKWRQLRTKLTPTFTSGKMKFMYPTILNVAKEFKATIDQILAKEDNPDIEIKELLARFTTDVIGECAFGIECNSLKNPEAEFRVMGRKVFETERSRLNKFILISAFPNIAKFLRVTITRNDVSNFFMGIVRYTVAYRSSNDVKRNDFVDLLMKLQAPAGGMPGITMNELSAQAYVFFLAGFETSSTVMSFALYELAFNKDIQTKARNEIKEVLEKYNGNFSYEAMLDMPYLEQILSESLRKYPPVTNLMRKVTKPYKVPDMDFTFEENVEVWIPALAIHHDPEYYPNPELFDPERFTPEEVLKRNNVTYIPFGEGPRNCIGLRFGLMQARIGLVTLLSNYEISFSEKATVPLVISKRNFILTAEGGIYMNFKKIS